MSEEAKPAETPNAMAAPEAAETAPAAEATVSVETTPEVQSETKSKPEERKFTQAEVEAMIGKRLDRAERKLRREFEQRQAQPQKAESAPAQAAAKPIPDNFKTTEDYIEAVAEWKAEQIVGRTLTQNEAKSKEQRAQEYAANIDREYRKREQAVRLAIPDFDDVVYGEDSLWVSDHPGVAAMAQAVQHVDRGPELAHYLATHREDFARISHLHPLQQAVELGKLAAKMPSVSAPAKTTTSAPEPLKPLTGGKSATPALSIDDPKAAEKMSTSEWIRLREQEKRKKLESQGYR